MKFKTRDWLDSKELRRCSPAARGLLADLMALAHEGTPYGYLRDKFEALSVNFLAQRCHVSERKFVKFLDELIGRERVVRDKDGNMLIPQMVKDEKIRQARASGGSLGGNPKLTEGYPYFEKNGYPLPENGPRAREVLSSSLCLSVTTEQEALTNHARDPLALLEETCELYVSAGLPVPERHKQQCLQLLISAPDDHRPRLPAFVRHMLESGRWSSPAKTKALLNLLRDGDWDVPIVERTIPVPVDPARETPYQRRLRALREAAS